MVKFLELVSPNSMENMTRALALLAPTMKPTQQLDQDPQYTYSFKMLGVYHLTQAFFHCPNISWEPLRMVSNLTSYAILVMKSNGQYHILIDQALSTIASLVRFCNISYYQFMSHTIQVWQPNIQSNLYVTIHKQANKR